MAGLDPLERPAPQVLEGLEDEGLVLRERFLDRSLVWGPHATSLCGHGHVPNTVGLEISGGPGSRRAPVSDLGGTLDSGSYSY